MKKLLLVFFALLFAYSGFAQCTAGFSTTSSPLNNALLRVALTNTSVPGTIPTGGYASYLVIWGDGSSNGIGSGTYYHNYASPGTYTAMLILRVVDSLTSTTTCLDTFDNSVVVAYAPCATSFVITKSPSNPLQVNVTATNPAGTSGMSYSWNWGDGSPAGSGASTSHTYASGGVKTITLTAAATGCSYNNVGTVSLSNGCSGLTANFGTLISGSMVTFSNTSTISGGLSSSATWLFGDGSSSTSLNPTHNYTSTGTFSVTLINRWQDSIASTNCYDTVIRNVTITSVTNEISGYVILDSTYLFPYPEFKVWLIDFDSATNVLSAVDSTNVTGDAFGMYTAYSFTGHSARIYRTKAQLTNGPTSGTTAIPTYHNSSLLWSSATLIYHPGGLTGGKNIVMQYGAATSGPGFIGGNVSAGANKGTSSGIPDMTILLLDATQQPVAYTVTDANGDYKFSNLAPASYSVYPENAGFATTPVSITVLNNNPTFNGINFSRSITNRSITPATTSIASVNSTADFAIYPNPAKDKIMVSCNNLNASDVNVLVTDITGKKVQQATMTSGKAEMNLGGLQKGLYFITLEANNVKSTQKLLLQ